MAFVKNEYHGRVGIPTIELSSFSVLEVFISTLKHYTAYVYPNYKGHSIAIRR